MLGRCWGCAGEGLGKNTKTRRAAPGSLLGRAGVTTFCPTGGSRSKFLVPTFLRVQVRYCTPYLWVLPALRGGAARYCTPSASL